MAKKLRNRRTIAVLVVFIGTVTVVAGFTTPSAFALAPMVVTVPGPPAGVTASPGYASATVSWRPPSSDGGSPITNYRVTLSPGSEFCKSGEATSCTVTGLKTGTTYTVSVRARNKKGFGSTSASVAVTPGSPLAPTEIHATAGNAQATVTWTAAADNRSPITHYTVTSNPESKTCTAAATSCTMTGLKNDTAYEFRVSATNARGTGPESAFSPSVFPPIVRTIPLDDMYGISSDGTHVWVANYDVNTVTELDVSNGSVIRNIAVADGPWGVSADGTHVWVTNEGSNTVTELNASDGSVVQTIPVGNTPEAISSDGTHVWVTDSTGVSEFPQCD